MAHFISRSTLLVPFLAFLLIVISLTAPTQAQDRERCDTNGRGNFCAIGEQKLCPPCWVAIQTKYECSQKIGGRCTEGAWDRQEEIARRRGEGARMKASHGNDSESGSKSGSDVPSYVSSFHFLC
ncbi:MAG: hypothetical protein J3R72DRAFT_421013 [Linnemannia gamsii]|nr:MAG: hypothetical protein J3R72DRAFT_421013 [Linnemannia gamsii]